jgi:hypothetical protein
MQAERVVLSFAGQSDLRFKANHLSSKRRLHRVAPPAEPASVAVLATAVPAAAAQVALEAAQAVTFPVADGDADRVSPINSEASKLCTWSVVVIMDSHLPTISA